MPIMNVHHPRDALDSQRKAALAQELTDALITMEGGANTAGGRGFAWVLFSPVDPGDWWIGGRLDDAYVAPPGRFLVHVTVPEGYMNAAHKSEVHSAVNAAVLKVTGAASEHPHVGASVLVVIDEVSEGNWGAAGKTISLASIADTVGLAKDGERFHWVSEYFEAKARDYAAAGYPADTGGLLPPAKTA